MSHTVVRGKPSAAQLYLDGVLNEVLISRGVIPDARGREAVSLPQILYHCMEKNLEGVFMTNAETGLKITNGEILKQAVPFARTLMAEGARGKVAIAVMDTDETTVAAYLAILFAGIVPLFLFPNNTIIEISHYLKLVEPSIVFCNERYYGDLKVAVESLPELQPKTIVLNELQESLDAKNMSSLVIKDASPDETVMLVPTSGSTGLPKACLLTHRGFISKLGLPWYRSSKFPTPTTLAMVISLPAQIVFHRMVSSCIVYHVPLLLPHHRRDEEWVKMALLTYRPTWTKFSPLFVKSLLSNITADHFSSLQNLMVSGARPCDQTKAAVMELLPKSAVLEEMYGMTEAHGVVAYSENGSPLRVNNTFEFKLIDDSGNTLGLCATGELCIRGPGVAKGYYRNNDESFEDGWYKTGDLFYVDEEEQLFYRERRSICFKFMFKHVSPEEVERVISSVPGVLACAVSGTERGAAAAVVAPGVTREDIHNAVNGALSEHKHLHGGVGFVMALPVSRAGKLDRAQCHVIIQDLVASGSCY